MGFRVNGEISAALAAFCHRGAGPAHSALTSVFSAAGYAESDPFDPEALLPNKQQRILAVCRVAEQEPGGARRLVDGLLDAFRQKAIFRSAAEAENIRNLRDALAHVGWGLSADGRLEPPGSVDLVTGGRPALDEQIRRLQRNIDDPAALLGGAKELLEAVAKLVLEEGGRSPDRRADFPGLIGKSFEQLGLQPALVDDAVVGAKQIRTIHQSAKSTALAVNELRNLQGTGHGRTLPTGVSPETARFVIREVTHVAELMLGTHDRQRGR